MDVLGGHPCILHALVAWLLGPLQQVLDQALKLGPVEGGNEVNTVPCPSITP